MIYSYNKTEMH